MLPEEFLLGNRPDVSPNCSAVYQKYNASSNRNEFSKFESQLFMTWYINNVNRRLEQWFRLGRKYVVNDRYLANNKIERPNQYYIETGYDLITSSISVINSLT